MSSVPDPAHDDLPRSLPPLVGREREQKLLRGRLNAALAGHGGLVLIGGEAGIGKTTLVEWLADEAARHGALVLAGGCYDLTTTPPYGPWFELFGGYASSGDLPALPDMLAAGITAARAARDVVLAVAVQQPLLLVLEDLHWSDPASLDLLRVIARQPAPARLLVLATYRVDELTRHDPLFRQLPLLVREAKPERVQLRPLDERAVRALVSNRYHLPQADEHRLAMWAQARAEGNPFFLGELFRTLEDEGFLVPGDETWLLRDLQHVPVPSLVQQIIEGRLARLTEETRALLAPAAVIGQDVPLDLWQAVSGAGDEDLATAIETALEAHLVRESHAGGVQFVHALKREVLYDSIVVTRRRALHRRVGDELERRQQPDPDLVAYHLQQAHDPRAVAWLVRAGDRAQRIHYWPMAAQRFDAAAKLLAGDTSRAGERAWLLYRAGRMLRHTDEWTSIACLEEAERLALVVGDAVLTAYAACDLGLLRCFIGDMREGLIQMEAGVRALDALPADHARPGSDVAAWVADSWPPEELKYAGQDAQRAPRPAINARKGTLIRWLAFVGRASEALAMAGEYLAQATESAADLAAAGSFADAYAGTAHALALLGEPNDARRAFASAHKRFRAIGNEVQTSSLVWAEFRNVLVVYETERVEVRRRVIEEAEATFGKWRGSEQHGGPGIHWIPIAGIYLLVIDGNWEEAARLLDAPRFKGRNAVSRGYFCHVAGMLARGQGRTEVAWASVHEVLPQGPASEPGNSFLDYSIDHLLLGAELALDAGELDTARAWIDALDRWLTWSESVRGQADRFRIHARFEHAAGNAAEAYRHATRALQLASAPRQPLAIIAAQRLLGQLDTESGRHAAAEQHLQAALTLAGACEAPFEHALTQLTLAELRAAEGRRDEARLLAEQARAGCTRLNAQPTLARITALLERLDSTPPAYPGGLTQRQVEVLQLIAAGKSNRDIADQLFLSERTVERHIENLYRKLDIHNRAEATAFALHHHLS